MTTARCTLQHRWPLSLLLLWASIGGPAQAQAPAAPPPAGKTAPVSPAATADAGVPEAPVEIVRRLCEARKSLSAAEMEAVLSEDYKGEQPDGSEVLYDRERGRRIVEWERGMDTRWDYRILGVDGNAVTVLLTEESAYFDLLDIGRRTQVTVYFVEGGRIARSLSKLDVQERGSQAREFRRFHEWMLRQIEHREPELIGSDGRLIFDGKSAVRMRHWLEAWHDAQK